MRNFYDFSDETKIRPGYRNYARLTILDVLALTFHGGYFTKPHIKVFMDSMRARRIINHSLDLGMDPMGMRHDILIHETGLIDDEQAAMWESDDYDEEEEQ